jgi:dihydrofolate reductase
MTAPAAGRVAVGAGRRWDKRMGKLIYNAIASLDGYTADETGTFDWAAPDEEVHAFVNDLVRSVAVHLYGRRMYETMRFWESPDLLADESTVTRDFARVWQAGDKIVYSRTLQSASTARTRIEPVFDAEQVRRLKATAPGDLAIGGADLAGQAIGAGLVDEYQLFLTPVVVGGGTSVFPAKAFRRLDLLEERRFAGGTVFLRYGPST